jgi:hypothetical protein
VGFRKDPLHSGVSRYPPKPNFSTKRVQHMSRSIRKLCEAVENQALRYIAISDMNCFKEMNEKEHLDRVLISPNAVANSQRRPLRTNTGHQYKQIITIGERPCRATRLHACNHQWMEMRNKFFSTLSFHPWV